MAAKNIPPLQLHLKTSTANRVPMSRYLVAAGGGLLLSAAYPGIGLAGAAWIAPGIILLSAMGCHGRAAFRLGFVAGLAHSLSTLYWLLAMPYTFHGIPLAPAAGWLALSAYCACYPALWVWLSWKIMPPAPANLPVRAALDHFFSTRLPRRISWSFAAAFIWVALEMLRGKLLTGFPWNFLAVSQYKMLPLIQITSVTGVYGLSFLMVWTSVSLVVALLALVRQPGRSVWGEAGLPLLVAAGVASYGASQVAAIIPPEEELNVVLIQPSFPQTVIWDATQDESAFQDLLKLSEQALNQSVNTTATTNGLSPSAVKPSLLIWPEGALSTLTPDHETAIAKLIAKYNIWLAASVETSDVSLQGTTNDFNSATLFDPTGELQGIYHKRRLVIFGEYVPKWLSFLSWMTPIDGELTPGTIPLQFKTIHPEAQFSVLVCFEDTFPDEARAHVNADTDFLLNLTNDGWFGDGAQPWQHAANAVFRAVENGIPLVRCTNNGLTCWIDGRGRMRQIFSASGNVYGPGFMTAAIPLRPAGDQSRTFYNRHGDWFGWTCCAMSLCLYAGTFLKRNKVDPGGVPI